MKQISIFAEENALKHLDKLGDPLKRIDSIMDWSPLAAVLEEARPDKTKTGKGGRPPISSLVLIKALMLGDFYNLSDEQIEYQITDRNSFRRFLGMSLEDTAPDRNTIWLAREQLKKSGKYDKMFDTFLKMLESAELQMEKGYIVDATFHDAPRRRATTSEQDKQLKENVIPDEINLEIVRKSEANLPSRERHETHKIMQVDVDARWAKKGEETHFGYKDHAVVEAKTKLIVAHEVTSASVHDSQKLADVVPVDAEDVYDDAGYVGEEIDKKLKEKCPNVTHHTCSKAYRNKPLTDEDKARNKTISRTRSRCEHVFGHMTYCMGGLTVRCIGFARAKCKIAMRDLAYNIRRFATLCKHGQGRSLSISQI